MKLPIPHCLLPLALFVSAGSAIAQSTLTGTVTDPSHAAIAGAKVEVIDTKTSTAVTVLTNASGVYTVSGLKPSQYRITISDTGFFAVTMVETIGTETKHDDVQLKLGSVNASVTVEGNKDPYGILLPPALIDLGPLGAQRPLDSPYQENEVSQEIIRSQNIRDAANFLEYDPSAQMSRSGNSGRPYTRGFESGVVENTRIDGMNIIITTGYPAEQFDRLEILEGVAGALYGPANPTGTFNYILKRPQSHPHQVIGYGYDALGVSTVYGDLGAHLGKVDSRLNIVYGDGESYTSTSNYRRFLASGSVDVHFNPSTVLELNASYYNWQALGFPATIAYGSGQSTLLPSALDATRTGYGVKGAGYDNYTNTFSGKILHDFGSNWHFNGGVLNQVVERGIFQPTFTMTDNTGDYKATIPKSGASRFTILSNAVYLNGNARTGPVHHAIFLGSNGFSWDTFSASGTAVTLGTGNLANPTIFRTQTRPAGQAAYVTSNIYQQALMAGDTFGVGQHWLLSLNASFSWLTETNYTAASKVSSQKAVKGEWSPTASLMYKPTNRQTGYISFSDSILQGDTAPTTAVNSGQTLAPYRSRQYEAGYKYQLNDRLLLTAAGFRINRPFASTDSSNVYRDEGMQVNWGSTFNVEGQLTRRLSVLGGFQQLIPTLTNTGVASTQGKDVVNAPRWQDNALFEYKMPWVRSLEVGTNFHYTGRRAANDRNTTFAEGYFAMDLNGSYLLPIRSDKHPLAIRGSLQNITNKSYWQSIYPTSGTSLAGSSGVLGTPRIASFSLDYTF